MIPEIGHLRPDPRAAGGAACRHACRWSARARHRPAGWRVARPAARGQFVLVALAFGCLAWSLRRQRLLGALRGDATRTRGCRCTTASPPSGAATKARCCCGLLMLGVLDAGGGAVQPRTCPTAMVARVLGVMGWSASASCCSCCSPRIRSTRLLPPARRRPRPESAAAGPGHGDPSADALHGLRRLLGAPSPSPIAALLVGRARRRLGALVAPLDHGGLDASSRSASRSAAPGPTTSSAGAAGGSGTRWRTPPSCPGWSARR